MKANGDSQRLSPEIQQDPTVSGLLQRCNALLYRWVAGK